MRARDIIEALTFQTMQTGEIGIYTHHVTDKWDSFGFRFGETAEIYEGELEQNANYVICWSEKLIDYAEVIVIDYMERLVSLIKIDN